MGIFINIMEQKGRERKAFEYNGKGERLCVCVSAIEFQEKNKSRKVRWWGDSHSLEVAHRGFKDLRRVNSGSESDGP